MTKSHEDQQPHHSLDHWRYIIHAATLLPPTQNCEWTTCLPNSCVVEFRKYFVLLGVVQLRVTDTEESQASTITTANVNEQQKILSTRLARSVLKQTLTIIILGDQQLPLASSDDDDDKSDLHSSRQGSVRFGSSDPHSHRHEVQYLDSLGR